MLTSGCSRLAWALLASLALPVAASAADLIVSANDGHLVRVAGRVTFPNPPPAADSLVVLDASQSPPAVKAVVEDGLVFSMQGPPQSVAITPDGTLAFVGTPEQYDYVAKRGNFLTFVQVVDLASNPPRVIGRVDVGAHPAGLSVSPDGRMLLASMLDGQVAVLAIDGKTVTVTGKVRVSEKRLSSVTFTHDGATALVGLRDDQGVTVLGIEGGKVAWTKERIATGVSPYAIDVSGDGRWAVVSNAGIVALAGDAGKLAGDADVVTVIDTSRRPFRAVEHVTVPATPEAAAISPDGRWIAVQSMSGSTFPADHPARRAVGKVSLYSLSAEGKARSVGELDGGEGAQGLVFTADSRTILVQFQVERQIAVYSVHDGKLADTGTRIPVAAGPGAIRAALTACARW